MAHTWKECNDSSILLTKTPQLDDAVFCVERSADIKDGNKKEQYKGCALGARPQGSQQNKCDHGTVCAPLTSRA